MTWLKLRPKATRNGAIAAVVLIICTWLVVAATTRAPRADGEQEAPTQGRRVGALYYPTPKQWATLTTTPVVAAVFRAERLTEGNAKLDPAMTCRHLVKRWRLWTPSGWSRERAP